MGYQSRSIYVLHAIPILGGGLSPHVGDFYIIVACKKFAYSMKIDNIKKYYKKILPLW